MPNNDSNNKSSWVVPITVSLIGAVSTVTVAWLSSPKGNSFPSSTPVESLSPTPSPSSIVGTYKIVGNNPGGGSYRGTLDIAASGSVYELIWNAADQPYIGVGILEGNNLAVSWGHKKCGVASYNVQPDKSLDGKWAVLEQEGMGLELGVASSSDATNDIASQYTTTGKSPSGSAYKDTLSIQALGSLYQFLWMDAKLKGVGIRENNTIAVAFGSVPCNVVLYRVREDGSLSGIWGLHNQNQVGTEEAIRQ